MKKDDSKTARFVMDMHISGNYYGIENDKKITDVNDRDP